MRDRSRVFADFFQALERTFWAKGAFAHRLSRFCCTTAPSSRGSWRRDDLHLSLIAGRVWVSTVGGVEWNVG